MQDNHYCSEPLSKTSKMTHGKREKESRFEKVRWLKCQNLQERWNLKR